MFEIPSWVNKYIGIPFEDHGRTMKACDCWGLIKLIYEREFNIEIPDYRGYEDTKDREFISHLMNDRINNEIWVRVYTEKAVDFGDIIIFTQGGQPVHAAMALTNRIMLHTVRGQNSVIESFATMKWKKRLEGFYRYNRA